MHQVSEKILLTIWIGAMWAIGYIVVPVLFKMLDKQLAGNIAGQLFTIVSYLGIFASIALIINLVMQYGVNRGHWQLWVLIGMLIIICIGQFVLQPMMAELKVAGPTGENAARFGRLHGISSGLFLINSVGGLALVITGLAKK